MATFAIHPPVHLNQHPDEPIRSVEAAIAFVERHLAQHGSAGVLEKLAGATNPAAAERAGQSFRDWAEREGHLMVPPETSP
jgi:hypothetical protein